jgi:hypothetical protein
VTPSATAIESLDGVVGVVGVVGVESGGGADDEHDAASASATPGRESDLIRNMLVDLQRRRTGRQLGV